MAVGEVARRGKLFAFVASDGRLVVKLSEGRIHELAAKPGFVAKGKEFPFTDKNDLIGKKGVTNVGESYGNEFDAFMKEKLDVARADGIDAAFKDLLDGKADYLIAGYYPGLAEAAKEGLKDKVVALNQALLSQEMFVAFSKKSPCASLASKFGEGITELTTNDSYDKILVEAQKAWEAQNK